MDASEDKYRPGDALPSSRSDPVFLVDSVRENIQRKIFEINSAAELEMERMDMEFRKEADAFREALQRKCDERLEYEGGKIRNLAAIEMKKQKLDRIETFINTIINDAAVSIKGDERYVEFLISCVISGIENVKGGSAEILVAADDLVHSDNIISRVSMNGFKIKLSISSDERVKIGGAMVVDNEAEIIYNNTVERIVYRNNEQIRRDIVRSLNEYGTGQDG